MRVERPRMTTQAMTPTNDTLTKLSEPEKTVFCLCSQEDPSQHSILVNEE